MQITDLLGRRSKLRVRRTSPQGALLAVDAQDEAPDAPNVLLPRDDVSTRFAVGDLVDVFVYLDSEGRPIATTKPPMLTRGEVRFLTVTDVTRIGAFVDWGLPKELLVPFDEQTRDVHVGERHPIGLYLDASGRLAGTMKVAEMLTTRTRLKPGFWVEGEAWRNEPGIGIFVILDRHLIALLPEDEPNRLQRGDVEKFRIASILPDGKIVVSLRSHAFVEIDADADAVLKVLSAPGAAPISEKADPDVIRERFGLSKKAFKRAVGRLLRDGQIETDGSGNLRVR
jgi:predicted RNA-binding protein (virulence factor B family)